MEPKRPSKGCKQTANDASTRKGKVLQAYDASEGLDERQKFIEDWEKELVKKGLKVQDD